MLNQDPVRNIALLDIAAEHNLSCLVLLPVGWSGSCPECNRAIRRD